MIPPPPPARTSVKANLIEQKPEEVKPKKVWKVELKGIPLVRDANPQPTGYTMKDNHAGILKTSPRNTVKQIPKRKIDESDANVNYEVQTSFEQVIPFKKKALADNSIAPLAIDSQSSARPAPKRAPKYSTQSY